MGFVTGFVDEIVQPLQTAASEIRQLGKAHTDANDHLQTQAQALMSGFQGNGSDAFLAMTHKQGNFIESIVNTLDETAGFFEQAAHMIQDAAHIADIALGGPLMEIADKVLAKLTPDIVVRNGESAVSAVINDMRHTFHQLLHHSGGIFGDLAHLDFSGAFHDFEHALGDLAHLAGDIFALLDSVEEVLGRWAARLMEASNWLINRLQSILFKVEDFVLGFSGIDKSAAILSDPNATSVEKGLAAAGIGLTLLGDVLLFIPGGQEGKIAAEGAEKLLLDEAEQEVEKQVETTIVRDIEQTTVRHVETTLIHEGENTFIHKVEFTMTQGADKTVIHVTESKIENKVETEVANEIGQKATTEAEETGLQKFNRLANVAVNADALNLVPSVDKALKDGMKQVTDWAVKHGLQSIYGQETANKIADSVVTQQIENFAQGKLRWYVGQWLGGTYTQYLSGKITAYELEKRTRELANEITQGHTTMALAH